MVAIFEYIDRLFNIVRPRRVLYMAIDGVVSPSRLNQTSENRGSRAFSWPLLRLLGPKWTSSAPGGSGPPRRGRSWRRRRTAWGKRSSREVCDMFNLPYGVKSTWTWISSRSGRCGWSSSRPSWLHSQTFCSSLLQRNRKPLWLFSSVCRNGSKMATSWTRWCSCSSFCT